MRNLFTIWRRDLTACFLSPVAYVTMVIFLALSGWVFLQMAEGHVGATVSLPTLMFKVVVFFWLPVLVTIITMRLFAEEKRSGTIETLLTAPVSDADVVLGKFAGALSFLLIVAVPALGSVAVLAWLSPAVESMDWGAMAGGLLILVLLSCFCVSIGLLVSLMTKNQIVAAVCCFCGVLVPLLAAELIEALPWRVAAAAPYLAATVHVVDFARGSIDTRPVVLYLSGTVYVLFVAVRLLESRRWR